MFIKNCIFPKDFIFECKPNFIHFRVRWSIAKSLERKLFSIFFLSFRTDEKFLLVLLTAEWDREDLLAWQWTKRRKVVKWILEIRMIETKVNVNRNQNWKFKSIGYWFSEIELIRSLSTNVKANPWKIYTLNLQDYYIYLKYSSIIELKLNTLFN